MSWTAIAVFAVGAWLLKAAGVLVGERASKGPALELIALLPAALFAALVALQTFASGSSLVLDARAIGFVVAVVAAWRRLPFVTVIVLAMAATAAARSFGVEL